MYLFVCLLIYLRSFHSYSWTGGRLVNTKRKRKEEEDKYLGKLILGSLLVCFKPKYTNTSSWNLSTTPGTFVSASGKTKSKHMSSLPCVGSWHILGIKSSRVGFVWWFLQDTGSFFGSTAQLGRSLSSLVFLCYVPFTALLFSPWWDSLVRGVLKYYICLLYLNCLTLWTCFKPGNTDNEKCVFRRITWWKMALPVMQCWTSSAMVITSFQASLNGPPESQVVWDFMPQT